MIHYIRSFGPIASALNKNNTYSYSFSSFSLNQAIDQPDSSTEIRKQVLLPFPRERFSSDLSKIDRGKRETTDMSLLDTIRKEPAIYRISNINPDSSDFGKVYIGSSVRPRTRIMEHFSISPSSKSSSLNTAIRELGFTSFKFDILEYVGTKDKSVIRDRENFFLNQYSNKYNVTEKAYSNAGVVRSDLAVYNNHIRNSLNSANFKVNSSISSPFALLATDVVSGQTYSYISFSKAAKAFNTNIASIVYYDNCIRFFDNIPYLISVPNHQVSTHLIPRTIITLICITDSNVSYSFNSYANAALFLGCTSYKIKS